MKKLFALGLFLATAMAGQAQEVYRFEVGPYDVAYRGIGDHRYKLKKNVDLYQFFGLKRDTVIYQAAEEEPVENACQVNLSFSMPRSVAHGFVNVWGIDGAWKHRIGQCAYFNAGVSLSLATGKYTSYWKNERESMFMIGIPLSVEFCHLDRKKSTLYGGVGVIPAFHTSKGITDTGGKVVGNKAGLFVAPRVDMGCYVPLGGRLVRLGGFAQYNISCSGEDADVFKNRIGRFFLGANIGLVF